MYRTNIVIWTDTDPSNVEITRLAEEATDGCAICTEQNIAIVADEDAPDEARSFFNDDELGPDAE